MALAREAKNREAEGVWLGNLGNCYADLGQTHRAIEFHEQALAIAREIGDRRGEGNDLGNLGNCYYSWAKPAAPSSFTSRRWPLPARLATGVGKGLTSATWATATARLGQTRRAIEFHEQALAIRREIGDRRGQGDRPGHNLGGM